jgi:hypothetical protein
MSILQDLIPEVIPIQKCHMNMSLILNDMEPRIKIQDDLNRHKTQLQMYFQHDGLSQHFSVHVMEYLNQQVLDRWIGCDAPQSPDLTPL